MLTRIDTGALDGSLATELDCTALPAGPRSLVDAWQAERVVGAGVIKLTGGAWGQQAYRSQVLALLADDTAHDHTVWVERRAGDTAWCAGSIWWVLDGTALLASSDRDTRTICQALPYTPEIAELVVRRPPREHLVSGSLDELAAHVGADACWLYVEPADLDIAMAAAARAGSRWGVRTL